MYVKVTTSGPRRYVQLLESFRDSNGRVKKRTVATLGRLDHLRDDLDCVIDGLLKVAGRETSNSSSAPIGAASLSFEPARALGNVWVLPSSSVHGASMLISLGFILKRAPTRG